MSRAIVRMTHRKSPGGSAQISLSPAKPTLLPTPAIDSIVSCAVRDHLVSLLWNISHALLVAIGGKCNS
jgi:hypothetical protein